MRRRVPNARFNPNHSLNRNSHYGHDFMGETTEHMCYRGPTWQGWQHREWSNHYRDWAYWSPTDECWYRRKVVPPGEGPAPTRRMPRPPRQVYVPLDNRTNPRWHGGCFGPCYA